MQTIPRSELQAVVEVTAYVTKAEIVTDSQYALDSVEKILTGMTKAELCNQPNGDLLLELQERLADQTRDYIWTKVKSHQTEIGNQPIRKQLYAVGNEAADVAAKEARRILADATSFVTKQELQERREFQRRHYEMAVALNKQRPKLDASTTAKNPDMDPETEQILHVEIAMPHEFEADERDMLLQWSTWGPGLMKALVTWLRGLQWPTEAFEPQAQKEFASPGISWVELLLDFQQAAQLVFPMNMAKHQQPQKFWELRTPTLHQGCHLGDMNMAAMIRSFQAAIKQAEKILNRPMIPSQRKVIRTLYQMGAGHQPIGIAVRPKLWKPLEVQRLLESYYTDHPRAWTFEEVITFEPEEPAISMTWQEEERQPHLFEEELRTKHLLRRLREWQHG